MAGCDYTGPARSVEGHISSKTDELHSGALGRNYRSRIEATIGEGVVDDEQDGPGGESDARGAAEGGLSPTLMVVASTVVLAVVVIASVDGEGEPELSPAEPELSPAELEDDSAAGREAW